ncbi:MAG: hypothetical protein MZV63_13260 [Marinilabiliales bacterium]|nr:hypothetical protein [Marinilabiliales bacterium]
MPESNPELPGHRLQFVVVADDQGNVNIPFPGRVSRQHIKEAVGHLGNQEGHAGDFFREMEFPGHGRGVRQ